MSIDLNQRPISGLDKFYGCEYCPLEFHSRQQRIQHTTTHFENKSCTMCHKVLLCINGDWYELHTSPGCDKDNESQHLSGEICTATNEIKVEAFDVVSDSRSIPQINDDDSSDYVDNDCITFDSHSKSHIEVNTLPPTVDSLTTLKTNLTISRTRVKKSPDVSTQDIARKKVQKIEKPAMKLVKEIEPSTNKPIFLNYRPLGSCFCEICNKTLANFQTLRSHILNQHCSSGRRERVKCDKCDLTFSTASNMIKHKRVHLKYKAFVCTYCGRGFNQMDGLREHTNQHTGERPYACTYCEKTFFRKTSLVKHIRVHTREKPYKCNIENCDRAYMYDIDLKRHKYSAHGIYTKKHICPICDKVYPENKLLKKHLQSHSTAQFETF